MVIHDGRKWRTPDHPMYHNGKKIVKIIRGGKIYYPGPDIAKIADRWNWGVFVDENNLFYDVSGGKIRIRDGLTGEVVDQSETAYGYTMSENLIAFQMEHVYQPHIYFPWYSCNQYKVVYKDGSSVYVTIPGNPARANGMHFGCRNGILAASSGTGGYSSWTFLEDGTFLNTLYTRGGNEYPTPSQVFPIAADRIGVLESYVTPDIFYQRGRVRYTDLGLTGEGTTCYPFLWSGYYSPTTASSAGAEYLGNDGGWCYVATQLHDPADGDTLIDDRIIARFSIENYAGPVELERYYEARSYTVMSPYHNLRRQRPGPVYEIYNPVTQTLPFDAEIGKRTTAYDYYENSHYIWYDAIYQKA